MAQARVERLPLDGPVVGAGARVLVCKLPDAAIAATDWSEIAEGIGLSGAGDLSGSIARTYDQYLRSDENRRALTVEAFLRNAFARDAHVVVISGAALGPVEREVIERYSARLSVICVTRQAGRPDRATLMSPFRNSEIALDSSSAAVTFNPTFEAHQLLSEVTLSAGFDSRDYSLVRLLVNGIEIEVEGRSDSTLAFMDVVGSTATHDRQSVSGSIDSVEVWRGYWMYPKIDESAEDLRGVIDDLARVDDPADLALELTTRVKRDLLSPRERFAFDHALDSARSASAPRIEAVVLPESIDSAETIAYSHLRRLLGQVQSAILSAEAEKDGGRANQLEAVWDDISARLRRLAPNVPLGQVRYEDRAETVGDAELGVGTHTVFNAVLTSYSNDTIAQAFERQSRMLAVLNKLSSAKLRLLYRIMSTRGPTGGLRPVVQVRCVVDEASAVEAAALRPSVGELIHATFVGIYGMSFSFDSHDFGNAADQLLWRSGRHVVSLRSQQPAGLAIAGFPDWAYMVDYLCSLDAPTVIELSMTAGTDAEVQEVDAVPDSHHGREEILRAIAASGVAHQPMRLQLSVSSDEPLSQSLLHLLAVETLGSGPGAFISGSHEWIDTTIGRGLRVFHPPFGNWFSGSRTPPSFRKVAPLSEFPPNGMPFGRANVSHPKGTQEVEVRIPDSDRLRHAYIIGRTGSGKTNLLRGMASHELRSPSTGLAVIDPHGDLASHVLNSLPSARRGEMQVMNFEDPDVVPVLNPLLDIGEDPLRRSQVVQEILGLLKGRVFHEFSGPRFDAIVRLVLDTMLDAGYPYVPALIDASVLLTNEAVQKKVRSSIRSEELKARWTSHETLKGGRDYPDLLSWVISKFDDLRHDSTLRAFLGGEHNTVDLERLASENGVLVVSIPEAVVGAQTAEFIGSLVLMKLRHALMSPDRRGVQTNPFFVYVDEFQKFADAGFDSFLSEARKFGVGLVMAHQNIEQLRSFSANTGTTSNSLIDSILGNVGTLAVFPVNRSDAERLASQLDVEPSDLVRLARFECLLRPTVAGIALPAFTLRTAYTQPALDPRRSDATRAYLIEEGLVRRRADVEAEVDDRQRLITATEPASSGASKRSVPASSFLDEWLSKRKRLAALQEDEPKTSMGSATSVEAGLDRLLSTWSTRSTSVSAPSNWTEVIGPVATADDVADYLGVSTEEVVLQSERGELVLLETSDGVRALPVTHLLEGSTVPGLRQVAVAVGKSPFSRWTQAAWLASPSPSLGGKSPIEWLREGNELSLVLDAANAYSEEAW